jgi:hypothetical protein
MRVFDMIRCLYEAFLAIVVAHLSICLFMTPQWARMRLIAIVLRLQVLGPSEKLRLHMKKGVVGRPKAEHKINMLVSLGRLPMLVLAKDAVRVE